MRLIARFRSMMKEQPHDVIYGALLLLPFILFIYSLTLGLYPIPVKDVARILISPVYPQAAHDIDPVAKILVLRVRLPRALAAMLIGSSLAGTGTAFQGIFKNPLVDSNLLGVTSGVGFGAALALTLNRSMPQVQLFAFFSV